MVLGGWVAMALAAALDTLPLAALGVVLVLAAGGIGLRERRDLRGGLALIHGLCGGLWVASWEPSLELLSVAPGAASETFLRWCGTAAFGMSLFAFGAHELRLRGLPSNEVLRAQASRAALRAFAFASLLVFSVGAFAAARRWERRIDLSYFADTLPSEATRDLVAGLPEGYRAIAFWPEGHPLWERVYPYLSELEGPKLQVQRLDHLLEPALVRRLRLEGNGSIVIFAGEGEDAPRESIELGLDVASARPRLRTFDALFREALSVLSTERRELRLTVGHGERSPSAQDGDASQRLGLFHQGLRRANVGLRELPPEGLAAGVPEGVPVVAAIGPGAGFSGEEVASLLSFVRQGGRLLLVVGAEGDDGGIAPLLSGLGLRRLPGELLAEDSHRVEAHDPGDRRRLLTSLYAAHPSVRRAHQNERRAPAAFENAVALGPTDEVVPGRRVVFPLRSAEDVWRDDGDGLRGEGEPLEAQRLMAAVEFGRLGNPGATREGRAVVIGDAAFAGDGLLRRNLGNQLVIADSLQWLLEGVGEGSPRRLGVELPEEDQPLVHTREEDRLLFYGTSFGAPLPLFAIGFWLRRRRRR